MVKNVVAGLGKYRNSSTSISDFCHSGLHNITVDPRLSEPHLNYQIYSNCGVHQIELPLKPLLRFSVIWMDLVTKGVWIIEGLL